MLKRTTGTGSGLQRSGRGQGDPDWKKQQEAAAKGLAELCKIAAEVDGGWAAIIANLEDNEVSPHVKAVRDASHNAHSIVMTWALRSNKAEEGLIILGKDDDRWMRVKVAGMSAIFDLSGAKATFTKKEAAAAYGGLNQKQQEEVKDAVREALGYDPSTAAGGEDDPLSILSELGNREEDPGVEFVGWLFREEGRETSTEAPAKPGLRKLGDKPTITVPVKRKLGKSTPTAADNGGGDPKQKLITLLGSVTGLKTTPAATLVKSLGTGKSVEDVRRSAVNFKVVTEDQLKEAGI